MIKLSNLSKSFGGRVIFQNINVEVNDGEVIGIIGASGAGKSLLLRILMQLDTPTSGSIELDGENALTQKKDNSIQNKVGMVFQNFNLFQNMSVIENVMSGPVHLQGQDPKEAFENAIEIIKDVGLVDRAYDYPKNLSGGQQQRAAIARTLAMKPNLILLDEPTSALDPMMKGEVSSVIRFLKSKGKTMIIASREMELIRSLCDRVLFIADGGIYEEGTPEEIFDNPKRELTRRFVHALRVLEFNIESKGFDFIGTQTTIAEFAYKNGVPSELTSRLEAIMEEFFQMVIIQPEEQNKMHISFEYDIKNECLNGAIKFSGNEFDENDPMQRISWSIIKKRASAVSMERIFDDGYTNKALIKID